jgi:hypothetical protein
MWGFSSDRLLLTPSYTVFTQRFEVDHQVIRFVFAIDLDEPMTHL